MHLEALRKLHSLEYSSSLFVFIVLKNFTYVPPDLNQPTGGKTSNSSETTSPHPK